MQGNQIKLLALLILLGGSGLIAFLVSSREAALEEARSSRPERTSHRRIASLRSDPSAPLPLDNRKAQEMDSTNYEVTVSDVSLADIGQRIERESRDRLRELTNRYQLTANQRREAFPLLVSYHADYTDGLIVNGFEARAPKADNLASELYLILDLNQQETYQEDVLANNEWWSEILDQLRTDVDHSLYSNPIRRPSGDQGSSSGNREEDEGPDHGLDALFGD